jgi:L-asparaginase
VYFNWKLIPGDRVHKTHAMHPDAFSAVNGQPLFFNPDWALESAQISERMANADHLSLETKRLNYLDPEELRKRCEGVRWFLAMPGTRPLWNGDERFVCLLGYGAGNMIPATLDSLCARFAEGRRPLIVACSQAEGGVKHPEGYDRVGMACLAKKGFRVWNQMDRSVEFVHSLCCYALAVEPDDPGSVLGRWLRECRE